MILWVIGIHLLISTGYGSIAPQTGSCSGEFKDAVPEIQSLSDSSAFGSSVMVDLAVDVGDRDGVELPELSQPRDTHNVGVRSRGPVLERGIDDRDRFNQHVDLGPGTSLAEVIESESGRQTGSSGAFDAVPYRRRRRSTPGAATSSQVVDLEGERQRLSIGALVIVPCGIWSSQWAVTDTEVPDVESGRQRGSTTGAGTSSQVIDLESGRQRFSSGAPDIAPYGIWSSLWAGTDSEVPDLESGRQWWSSSALDAVPYPRPRWSTPGAGTSSQVIDFESRRESARRSNQRSIKLGFAILLGSTYALTSISVGDRLSPRNRFISYCVSVINIVGFVSLTAANMSLSVVIPSSTPSTDTHTTQTANTILSTLGLAISAYGFILMIAMGLPDHLLWLIVPALIALVLIFVSTPLARRHGF